MFKIPTISSEGWECRDEFVGEIRTSYAGGIVPFQLELFDYDDEEWCDLTRVARALWAAIAGETNHTVNPMWSPFIIRWIVGVVREISPIYWQELIDEAPSYKNLKACRKYFTRHKIRWDDHHAKFPELMAKANEFNIKIPTHNFAKAWQTEELLPEFGNSDDWEEEYDNLYETQMGLNGLLNGYKSFGNMFYDYSEVFPPWTLLKEGKV